MSPMPSCWEAGPLTSALLAAGQHHRVRTQDGQPWTAKRHFSSKIPFSSLAALWACESNSATRPVAGILSRWWWTGGWTGRLGREWWLAPDYTSCDWVPFSSIHTPATAIKTGCLLQQGVRLCVSPLTPRYNSPEESEAHKNGTTFQNFSDRHKNGLFLLKDWRKCIICHFKAKNRFYRQLLWSRNENYTLKFKHQFQSVCMRTRKRCTLCGETNERQWDRHTPPAAFDRPQRASWKNSHQDFWWNNVNVVEKNVNFLKVFQRKLSWNLVQYFQMTP